MPRQRHKPTTPNRTAPATASPAADTTLSIALPQSLTLTEEDAYSHILMLADNALTDEQRNEDTRIAKRHAALTGPETGVSCEKTPRVCAKAKLFLIHYFSGLSPRRAMAAAGINWGDITLARTLDRPYFRAVEWVHSQRSELLRLKALSIAEDALDGAEVGAEALRFAKFILQSTDRGTYADNRSGGAVDGAAGHSPAVVYNINLFAPGEGANAPNQCNHSATIGADDSIIDIKAE